MDLSLAVVGVGDSLPASVVMGLLATLGGPADKETEERPTPPCCEEIGDFRARSCSSASFCKETKRRVDYFFGTEPVITLVVSFIGQ